LSQIEPLRTVPDRVCEIRQQLPAVNGFGLDDELRVALHEPDSAQALDTAKAERISLAARA